VSTDRIRSIDRASSTIASESPIAGRPGTPPSSMSPETVSSTTVHDRPYSIGGVANRIVSQLPLKHTRNVSSTIG
jgi:hypothetical protein